MSKSDQSSLLWGGASVAISNPLEIIRQLNLLHSNSCSFTFILVDLQFAIGVR